MGKSATTGLSAVGFAVGGYVMPLMFPKLDPLIGYSLLTVAFLMIVAAFVLWIMGRRAVAEDPASPVSASGKHPTAIGINHGTVNVHHGVQDATQHRKQAPARDPNQSLRDDIERARLERERLDVMSSLEFGRALDAYRRFEPRAPAPLEAASEAEMDKDKPGTVNVTSHGQQGGITAHTVHVAKPPARPFGEAEKAAVLDIVPRDSPLTILAPLGDQEATHLATQIHSFLKTAGQRFAHDLVMVTPFAQPQTGIVLQATRNGHDLIVGSND